MLVDLRTESSYTATVNITTPPNIVNGSRAISVSLVGKPLRVVTLKFCIRFLNTDIIYIFIVSALKLLCVVDIWFGKFCHDCAVNSINLSCVCIRWCAWSCCEWPGPTAGASYWLWWTEHGQAGAQHCRHGVPQGQECSLPLRFFSLTFYLSIWRCYIILKFLV